MVLWRFYTGRFTTTIFTATQRCNIVATLFRIVPTLFQHCSNIATMCCAENRRCGSCNITFMLEDFEIEIRMEEEQIQKAFSDL